MAKSRSERDPSKTASKEGMDVYVLKVHFKARPKVHRTLEMTGDSTLEELHLLIQGAIGWAGDHMYAFYMSGKALDEETEYYPDHPEEDWPAHPGRDAKVVRLDSERLALRPGTQFLYLFDFGDEHKFGIEVLDLRKGVRAKQRDFPKLVDSKGRAPEQY